MQGSHRDRYGNTLSTTSDAAAAYDAGLDHVLGAAYGGVEAFERAVAADPGFALGHVGLARASMVGGDMAGARAAMDRAVALSDGVTDREASHVAAFRLLFEGNAAGARAHVRRHVRDWPRDALCAQLCTGVFGLIGFSGLPGREAELLAFTEALSPHYEGDWWMMAMHATSLCETGQTAASRALMERSLALNPRNAHAAHFKGHAAYENGETEAGLAYLSDWIEGYDRRGMLHGHLSWHIALWALELGDTDRVWRLMDEAIGPDTGASLPINVVTDTAAMLFRLEIAGHEAPAERWRALSAYAARYFPESGQSFADLHVALAHAMAGEGDLLARFAEGVRGFAADLVSPAARAWAAITRRDWAEALALLTPVMADHVRLGGSRAQRDLLELTWLHVLLKLGHAEEARRTLSIRRPAIAPRAPVAQLH